MLSGAAQLLLIIFLAVSSIVPQRAIAQSPIYQITQMGNDTTFNLNAAYGINASGQVVGFFTTPGDFLQAPRYHPFLWTPSTPNGTSGILKDLGDFGGYIGLIGSPDHIATALNDKGEVVGYSRDSTLNWAAFLWLPSPAYGLPSGLNKLGVIDKSSPNLFSSISWAINNQGQVIGTTISGRGFLWQNSQQTDLPFNNPHGINNNGVITGSDPPIIFDLATSQVINLATLPIGVGSTALAINDSNEVVGSLVNPTNTILSSPFYWKDLNGNGKSDVGEMITFGGAVEFPLKFPRWNGS